MDFFDWYDHKNINIHTPCICVNQLLLTCFESDWHVIAFAQQRTILLQARHSIVSGGWVVSTQIPIPAPTTSSVSEGRTLGWIALLVCILTPSLSTVIGLPTPTVNQGRSTLGPPPDPPQPRDHTQRILSFSSPLLKDHYPPRMRKQYLI